MAGSITDISDRKEADEERFLAVQETLFANRAKTEFFANTSHELRTPMNAIIGFCELLMAGVPVKPTGRQSEYFEDIHKSALHLLSVINDILDLSKIESNAVNLQESEIEIAPVVASSFRLLSMRAEERGLTLQNQVRSKIPNLWADEQILKQINELRKIH